MKTVLHKGLIASIALIASVPQALALTGNMTDIEAQVSELVIDSCPKELTKEDIQKLQNKQVVTARNHEWAGKDGVVDYQDMLTNWKGNVPLQTGSSGLPHEGPTQPTAVSCYYSYQPINLEQVSAKALPHVVTISATVETKR